MKGQESSVGAMSQKRFFAHFHRMHGNVSIFDMNDERGVTANDMIRFACVFLFFFVLFRCCCCCGCRCIFHNNAYIAVTIRYNMRLITSANELCKNAMKSKTLIYSADCAYLYFQVCVCVFFFVHFGV